MTRELLKQEMSYFDVKENFFDRKVFTTPEKVTIERCVAFFFLKMEEKEQAFFSGKVETEKAIYLVDNGHDCENFDLLPWYYELTETERIISQLKEACKGITDLEKRRVALIVPMAFDSRKALPVNAENGFTKDICKELNIISDKLHVYIASWIKNDGVAGKETACAESWKHIKECVANITGLLVGANYVKISAKSIEAWYKAALKQDVANGGAVVKAMSPASMKNATLLIIGSQLNGKGVKIENADKKVKERICKTEE